MGQAFKTVNTSNQELNLIQSNISDALNSINGPFIGGQLIQGVPIGTSPTVINHKLSRKPQIWVICDQDTLTNVARTSWNSNSITLEAGSACTISLWVN